MSHQPSVSAESGLRGKRAAVLLFSYYPSDPRPRRAAEALAQEGMQVDVVCLKASSDEPIRQTVNGVNVLRLPLKRRRGGAVAYFTQYTAFIAATFAVLSCRSLRRRFAIVHVHNMPDVLVFSALVPKMLGAKVLLDLHDPMPELMRTIFGLEPRSLAVRILEHFERWSIAFADVVFTVNAACRKLFAARGSAAGKIHVVMNSPDEGIFAFRSPAVPVARAARPFVIMYHGSILERNGLDVAVQALATVRNTVPDAELRIYGEATPFLESVMDTVRSEGLQERVHYLGPKGLEDIVAAIDACDVGVIPNRRTVFTEINTPTRIFEYLARGKPVITGRAAGVQDYFADDAVFFFELGDPKDLAVKIVDVARRADDVLGVVRRGQQVYLSHRWSEERKQLVRRVSEVVSARRVPNPTAGS